MKKILPLTCFALAGLIGWAIWFPFRAYLFSVIPDNKWGPLLKVIVTVGIGYFGGIGLPAALVVFGLIAWLKFS